MKKSIYFEPLSDAVAFDGGEGVGATAFLITRKDYLKGGVTFEVGIDFHGYAEKMIFTKDELFALIALFDDAEAGE